MTIRVDPAAPTEFAVNLRIPAWAKDATVRINNTPEPARLPRAESKGPRAGQFHKIHRTWNPGDKIELTLPLEFRAEPIDVQHSNVVAVMRGPVMQVGIGDKLTLDHVDPPVANYSVRFVPFYKINDEPYTTYFTRK